MNFQEYQELSRRTMPAEINGMSKSNYALGLVCEAGEVGDIIKKEVHHGHEEDKEKIMNEIGDVLHYAAGVATMYGFTLEEAATKNVLKLGKRYPMGFSTADSIARVDTK
jgi:NTP pyrophosphatase (non-canonical NTP hydrolase)